MQKRRNCKCHPLAGYSLVEVTLALLVVAIGLTATFALFPEGLRLTRQAVNETEIALFSEYVFTTLDLTAAKEGGNKLSANIALTDTFISPMLLNDPKFEDRFQLRTSTGTKPETFFWMPDYYGLDANNFPGSDYAATEFRKAEFYTSVFTYTLQIGVSTWKSSQFAQGATTFAVLKVWPGEFSGQGLPKGEPRVFYREIVPVR